MRSQQCRKFKYKFVENQAFFQTIYSMEIEYALATELSRGLILSLHIDMINEAENYLAQNCTVFSWINADSDYLELSVKSILIIPFSYYMSFLTLKVPWHVKFIFHILVFQQLFWYRRFLTKMCTFRATLIWNFKVHFLYLGFPKTGRRFPSTWSLNVEAKN